MCFFGLKDFLWAKASSLFLGNFWKKLGYLLFQDLVTLLASSNQNTLSHNRFTNSSILNFLFEIVFRLNSSTKLHDGNLHAVGWGEGPWALVTPVKAIRVGVGL